MMGRRYTPEEDAFILQHYKVGFDTIAKHDLDRSERSIRDRFNLLTETGARHAYAKSQIAMLDFLELSSPSMKFWKSEFAKLTEGE